MVAQVMVMVLSSSLLELCMFHPLFKTWYGPIIYWILISLSYFDWVEVNSSLKISISGKCVQEFMYFAQRYFIFQCDTWRRLSLIRCDLLSHCFLHSEANMHVIK